MARQPGEFVPIAAPEATLPEPAAAPAGPGLSPVPAALLVGLLGLGQVLVSGMGAMVCRGGCAGYALPLLLMMGILSAAGLYCASIALRGFSSAGFFSRLLIVALLVPGLVSVAGACMVAIGVLSAIWAAFNLLSFSASSAIFALPSSALIRAFS